MFGEHLGGATGALTAFATVSICNLNWAACSGANPVTTTHAGSFQRESRPSLPVGAA